MIDKEHDDEVPLGHPRDGGRMTRKLRPDVAQIAHRVGMEATGQWPKTKPPEQRTEEDKNPEAVRRGRKGGLTKAKRERSA